MIKFVICEDEGLFRKKTKDTIDKMFIKNDLEYIVLEFDSYTLELNNVINDKSSGKIYLLDINLKGTVSGMDIARRIRNNDWNSVIIFITSHLELGNEALRAQVMALDFISKFDNWIVRLEKTIKKAVLKLNSKDTLSFESNNTNYRIFLDDIIYITKMPVYKRCLIKTTHGEIIVNKTLCELVNMLDDSFYMTHRSCVVNTNKIISVDWNSLVIEFNNLEKIDLLAKNKKRELKKYIEK